MAKERRQLLYPKLSVRQPELLWSDEGVPISAESGDVYYSKSDGLLETHHVFLEANNLAKRFAKAESFTIFELGFGLGLNFLATLELWKLVRADGAKLNYIAIDKFLPSARQIRKAMSLWPELKPSLEELLLRLPLSTMGVHTIRFVDSNVALRLVLGDARDFLPFVSASADAIFLDGFAPAANAEMWTPQIFSELGRLSKAKTSLSTFSAASSVRRGLETAGFEVVKTKGFKRKREMLVASRGVEAKERVEVPKRVAVIGAGIAGVSAARAISERGAEVVIFEANHVASGASGNHLGMIMPHLSAEPDVRTRFSLSAFSYFLELMREFNEKSLKVAWEQHGVCRLLTSKRLSLVAERLEALGLGAEVANLISATEVEKLAGIEVSENALYFPKGGVVSPKLLCEAISEGIEICYEAVSSIDFDSFDAVVVATANEAVKFKSMDWLPLEPVRGEVFTVAGDELNLIPKCAVCYDGYITSSHDGCCLVGATYEHDNFSTEQYKEKQTELERRLGERTNVKLSASSNTRPGRVSFRASTPDRMPIVGRVPVVSKFESSYSPVKYSAMALSYDEEFWFPNLYLSVGHGSQGLLSAPISGELIASQMFSEPLPLDSEIVDLINPLRFLVRDINRRESNG